MQSLLRWSIENSTPLDGVPNNRAPAAPRDLDPAIIDMILGKPDAELMKENLATAVDSSLPEDDRISALDQLEMLIEQIDNANNLEKLKMWEPLHSLLTSDTSTLTIKMQALWVIGTALQNNPSAQDSYFSLNPLSTLISFLIPSPSSNPQIRSKAIYTLSGLLKHHAPAVQVLGHPDVDGWTRLRDSLQDPEITVRRKAIFLLGTLLLPTTPSSSTSLPPNVHASSSPSIDQPSQPIHENSHAAHLHNPSRTSTSELTFDALRNHRILEATVSALTKPVPYGEDGDEHEPDADFEEKSLRLLYTYAVTCRGEFSRADKKMLKAWFEAEKVTTGETDLSGRWGLDAGELKTLYGKII